jgi:LysM domain
MAKLRYIGSSSTRRRRGPAAARGALALGLTVALVFSGVSPAWAVIVEVESEGEGGAPPGALPGLEEGSELGGEETVLGETPPAAGEEGEEEAPPEYEAPPSEAPPPAPEAPAPVAPEIPAEPEAPIAVPPAAEPIYESGAGPDYQTEAAAPPVVRGESLVASPSAPPRSHDGGQGGRAAAPPSPEAPSPIAPPAEAPPPAAPPVEVPELASVPPAEPAEPGALAGRHFHVVRPGESLWSIATALRPPGAANVEIAAEVQRLWRLNAARIGTGDPNLILVGTRLRLV